MGPRPFGDEDVIMTPPPDSTVVSEDEYQETEQESKPAQEQNSDTSPGSPERDAKKITSPPKPDDAPIEDSTPTIDTQSTGTEDRSTQSKERLETPPHEMETEPKSTPAGSAPPDPEDTPTSPAKPATPAPSIDENGISESSSELLVIFDKETGMGISLGFEPREPLT